MALKSKHVRESKLCISGPARSMLWKVNLFTALMRANGIPTRILEGWWTLKGLDFKNKHLWCEFWDNQKEEWVFVDTHSLAGGSFETLPPVIDYYFVKFCDTSTNDCYMAEPDDSINERYFPESQKMEIPGDTDGNDDVSDTELLVYIDLWTQGFSGWHGLTDGD